MPASAKRLLIVYAACLTLFTLIAPARLDGQVGIGTTQPAKSLSVDGTLLVDQENRNFGTLDSAALLLGTATGVGLTSSRVPGSPNLHGLDFWTNNLRRLQIASNGYVGIGFSPANDPTQRLDVNGNIRSRFNITSDFQLNGGSLNITGNSSLGHLGVNGYAAIGTNPSSSYRLNVNGNLLVQTNLGVDGNLRVDGTSILGGKVTNEGKAIMLSNSGTTLRSGFTSGTFTLALNPGSSLDITFIITPFTGNNGNVRVMVGQLVPGSGASNWSSVVMTPHGVLADDPENNDLSTCKIRFTNTGSTTANLGTNAVLYLYSVVTH